VETNKATFGISELGTTGSRQSSDFSKINAVFKYFLGLEFWKNFEYFYGLLRKFGNHEIVLID